MSWVIELDAEKKYSLGGYYTKQGEHRYIHTSTNLAKAIKFKTQAEALFILSSFHPETIARYKPCILKEHT